MPRVVISRDALSDIKRLKLFLAEMNPAAAEAAARAILDAIRPLHDAPDIGRPYPDRPGLRELIIRLGKTGYAALYDHDRERGEVRVLSVKHLKEASYKDR